MQQRILIYLGHPAHYHLFKNLIKHLITRKSAFKILIKKKDVLEALLTNDGIPYENILPKGRKDGMLGIVIGLAIRNWQVFKISRKFKPTLMLGTSAEIAIVGRLLGIKSIVANEDDYSVIKKFADLAYPFATHILAPDVCDVGKYTTKKISYNSYHELAYLHPNNFKTDITIAQKYVDVTQHFFILRFAQLNAFHDIGKTGIDKTIAIELINILAPKGKVFITSERALEKELEPYRININPIDIHHVMAFASLYIGDSQTMAAEAAVLGIPGIRFNDFVGQINYLEDLEHTYLLTTGIRTNQKELLLAKTQELTNTPHIKEIYQERRLKMLSEKIDLTELLINLIN